MIVPINNNFSPLPFYKVEGDELKNKYLNGNRPYSYGDIFDLPIDEGWLMPFQFTVDFEVDHVGGCFVIPISNTLATEALNATPSFLYDGVANTTILFYGEQHSKLPVGRMYIEVELYDKNNIAHIYMSDLFTNISVGQSNIKKVPKGYVRIEYSNDHFLRYNGGKVYLDDQDFSFDVLVDSTIGKPDYTFEEKSSDRLGYRYIESQVSNKSYGFTFVAPEYLCDAIRLLPMCNIRTISDELNVYNDVTDVNVEVEWLEQGNLASVHITFNHDAVVANLAEYVSVAPAKLNTVVPLPPTPEVIAPSVIIGSITGLQQTQFTVNSEVVSDGGGTLVERGVCWSAVSSSPNITDSHLASSPAELGQYSINLTNLLSNTLYYIRAYVENEVGIAYSDVVSVRTLEADALPTAVTYAATNIHDVYADVTGSVTDEGSQTVTSRGFLYSSSNGIPTIDGGDVRTVAAGSGQGSYMKRLEGLSPDTQYHYRAYAVSAVGVAYGAVMRFTTLPNEPIG